MDTVIRSGGTPSPFGWVINKEGHGVVSAISESIQHHNSHTVGQAYQVIGTATPVAGTACILHIKNTSTDKDLVVNYVRCQVVDAATDGTAYPNASNYFRLAFNRTWSSGGSVATPVNMNPTSGNTAQATAYSDGPTLAGTALEFDVEYVKAEAELTRWSKEGSIVIQPNGTMEISYVGDFTDGTAYARISFLMQAR